MACTWLSARPLGAPLLKHTSGTVVGFPPVFTHTYTHAEVSFITATFQCVCVCVCCIYFQAILGLFTTTNPLVGRHVCECKHL